MDAVGDSIVAPVAPVRMMTPPRRGQRTPAASSPQTIDFRVPWVGEFVSSVLTQPKKIGNSVVHPGAEIEEAILGVISGKVYQGGWFFQVRVDSGDLWVTNGPDTDLNKAGVVWLAVQTQ